MTFRFKLLLSILAVVSATTGATLKIAQDQARETYRSMLDTMFRSEIESFESLQEQRLELGKNQARLLSGSVRLFAALEEADPELIYEVAQVELREADFDFYRLADASGSIIPTKDNHEPGNLHPAMESDISSALKRTAAAGAIREGTHLGFVIQPAMRDTPAAIYGVVSGGIVNQETKQFGGTLILGKKVVPQKSRPEGSASTLVPALRIENQIWSPHLPPALQQELIRALEQRESAAASAGEWTPRLGGRSFRADLHLLNPGSLFPQVHLVSLYPLETLQRAQQALFRRVAAIAGCGLLAAAAVGLAFAHRLSKPVHDLVRGTNEIRQGNFDVRVRRSTSDELGTLADSFNEMAAGLALKEKYRSVLQLVTDRSVADELMSGAVQLGGETRKVSVIFCDIRGFTGISQDMAPADVVAMLNEHMSALTHVVHQHHGVVDKFVGDSIMTLFGAPKSYGDDAVSAVRCAWEMIRERERLNATSAQPLRIGIGIATGDALAGCMGSEKRLNYTVIGGRVNLAARLCSKAGPMEIVIDEATRAALPPGFETEKLDALELKGFSEPVTAYRIISVPS